MDSKEPMAFLSAAEVSGALCFGDSARSEARFGTWCLWFWGGGDSSPPIDGDETSMPYDMNCSFICRRPLDGKGGGDNPTYSYYPCVVPLFVCLCIC